MLQQSYYDVGQTLKQLFPLYFHNIFICFIMCLRAIFTGGQFSTGRSFFDEIGRFSMEKGRFSTSNFDRGSLFDGGHFSPLHRQPHPILTIHDMNEQCK